MKATTPLDNDITVGNLCIKGRFGWRFVKGAAKGAGAVAGGGAKAAGNGKANGRG